MHKICLILLLLTLLTGCATPRPNNVENICKIFKQYPKWYWATQKTQKRWQVPIPVQMAIIYQESRFSSRAKPPRKKLLWVIPWKRPSSAYGYTQALKGTWENYQRHNGKRGADRDEFGDAVDFIGWYIHQAHKRLGIAKRDTYKLYLTYHEGMGGYERKTYLKKPWLIKVAHKVSKRSNTYEAQLTRCQSELKKKPWYRFW